MAVIQMTDDRFEEVVLKSELPVMVDFGATWCGPCKKVEPMIEEISEEYAGKMIAVKCDVEECPDTAAKFGIMNIPTVLYFKGGQPVDKNVGAAPKKMFVEKLEKLWPDILEKGDPYYNPNLSILDGWYRLKEE